MKQLNITFFGDSICVGQGVSISHGWVTKVALEMEALSAVLDINVVVENRSINGNTTRMALERMPYDIQSQNIDILILQFGLNDCNYWQTDMGLPRVSALAFEANLREIIERAICSGVKKVIINTNHPTLIDSVKNFNGNISYQANSESYNEIIRKVACSIDSTILCDINTIVKNSFNDSLGLSAYLLDDGLHLSKLGHSLYFDSIAKLVSDAVKKHVEDLCEELS